MTNAKELLTKLDFDGCIELIRRLESERTLKQRIVMIDMAMDRMESLDLERFDAWLDSELTA